MPRSRFASSVYAAVGVLGSPFAGRLLDRWGPRRVALPGVILTGIAFALLGTANSALITWLLLWLLYSATGQLILMQAWSAAVASNFVAGRGLAIAIVLTGSAVTATFIPRIAVALITEYGWRGAYGAMGAVWALAGGLLVFSLFRSKQDLARRDDKAAATPATAEARSGVSARDGLLSGTFIKLATAALAGEIVIIGIVVNIIPMLTKAGFSREEAAWMFAFVGISAIIGKLICGTIANRIDGKYIMAFLLALPIATALILMAPKVTTLPQRRAGDRLPRLLLGWPARDAGLSHRPPFRPESIRDHLRRDQRRAVAGDRHRPANRRLAL